MEKLWNLDNAIINFSKTVVKLQQSSNKALQGLTRVLLGRNSWWYSKSGKLKRLRIEKLSTSKYSSKWVQVNDSLIVEAKIGLVGPKNERNNKKCKSKVEGHYNFDLNHFISILNFLSFLGPTRPILAFKKLISEK